MRKLFLFSLVLVLIGLSILPALATPKAAEAWSGTVTCDPGELYFRVYAGVPTYLLGFIPLDEGQTLTLTHAGGFLESAGWTVSDDAGWLNEAPLFGVVGCIDRDQDVTVRVNTDGMDAGTYTAVITFKFTTCATKTITIPVTVDVIEPRVMGPLGIGVDKDLLKGISGGDIFTEDNEYGGLTVQLLTNPDDMMDMQAIETDGCWNLAFQAGEEQYGMIPILSGSLTINGETKLIGQDIGQEGIIAPITMLIDMTGGTLPIPADFDWGENYVAIFSNEDGLPYVGILLGDIGKILDLPLGDMLGDMFSTEAPASTDISGPPGVTSNTGNTTGNPTASADMVIPLSPILGLLPTLMPVMMDLLGNETILSILEPLMEMLPPIMIVMPFDMMMELFTGLM